MSVTRVPGKGWRCEPKADKPDSAVTSWALLALWSARQAGIPVEQTAVACHGHSRGCG